MTLIRVMRDDNFLKQMLVLIRRFYTSYVQLGRQPPQDMFYQRNDYQVLPEIFFSLELMTMKLLKAARISRSPLFLIYIIFKLISLHPCDDSNSNPIRMQICCHDWAESSWGKIGLETSFICGADFSECYLKDLQIFPTPSSHSGPQKTSQC